MVSSHSRLGGGQRGRPSSRPSTSSSPVLAPTGAHLQASDPAQGPAAGPERRGWGWAHAGPHVGRTRGRTWPPAPGCLPGEGRAGRGQRPAPGLAGLQATSAPRGWGSESPPTSAAERISPSTSAFLEPDSRPGGRGGGGRSANTQRNRSHVFLFTLSSRAGGLPSTL